MLALVLWAMKSRPFFAARVEDRITTFQNKWLARLGWQEAIVPYVGFGTPEQALDWMVENSGGHRDHDPSADIDITAEGPILGPDGTPNDH